MFRPVSQLVKYRELLFALAIRDIQVRYKQSIIGILWAVITPLVMTGIFVLVFSHFLQVGSDGAPYPIFAYACVAPWTLMQSGIPRATESLEANVALIRKIWFPRYLLPLSAIISALVDFSIASIILFVLMVAYGMAFTVFLLYLPLLLTVQIILIYGVSLILAPANAYYRDIKMLVPLAISVLFYACPIFYSVSAVPAQYRIFYAINPMVGLLDGYRAILVRGEAPNLTYFGISVAVTAVLLIAGYLFFKRMEKALPDVI